MRHALIIDDSSTARMYYREILEKIGFAVEEALNGLEGLEKSMDHVFDIILLDVNMPKMDGYTFLRHLRRTQEIRAVPVIMISTEARETDRLNAYRAGANLYIVKPVDPAHLSVDVQLLTGFSLSERLRA
jgi:two-component system chemotaxis response regulator CheY